MMNDPHFNGKTALVTGSGNGIGQASARAFAAKGARVVVSDIDLAAAEATAASIKAVGGEATAIHCDATNWDSVAALMQGTLAAYGSLDFVHNNVGCGVATPFEDMTDAEYHWISDVTFKSVFLGLRHEFPIMKEKGGAIVNTASMAGVSTVLSADLVYAGAKAAVIQMTAQAARRFGPHGIRVNCIAPGLVATKVISDMFTPEQQVELASGQLFKRAIRPEEIAAAVIYLCSAEAAMISGVCLPVDGGHNAVK